MFASNEWTNNKLSKDAKGKEASKVVVMQFFWNNTLYTVKVLVTMFHLVGSDKKPTMSYIYEAMEKARESIMNS